MVMQASRYLSAFRFSVLMALVSTGACGGDEGAGQSDPANVTATSTSRPVGTYVVLEDENASRSAPWLESVVFKTDKTFHAVKASWVEDLGQLEIDRQEIDGVYSFSKGSDGTRFLLKHEVDGESVTDRFVYTLAGDSLQVRSVGESASDAWEMTLASGGEAWCAEPADCGLQDLPRPKCPDVVWSCEEARCGLPKCVTP